MDELHTYLRNAEVHREYWRLNHTGQDWQVETVVLVKAPANKARSWKIRINGGRILTSYYGNMRLYLAPYSAIKAKIIENSRLILAAEQKIADLAKEIEDLYKLNETRD